MCVNRLKELLEERGLDTLRPSDKKLKDMRTTRHAWTKWINKTSDPELHQLQPLAEFMECSITELINVSEPVA